MSDTKPATLKNDSYTDCSGEIRTFEVRRKPMSKDEGFIVSAKEINSPERGYEFDAWSPCLGDALGLLRSKIQQELSRKYLTELPSFGLNMSHDMMRGRIDCDGVVVDGKFISWDHFIKILVTHEGFQFDLKISDPTE